MTKTMIAKTLASTEATITGLQEMIGIAEKHGMEFHADRLRRELAEMESELEHLIDEAISAGYGPEDFEVTR